MISFNKGGYFLKHVLGILILTIILSLFITFIFPFIPRYLFLYEDINAIFQLSIYILLIIILKNILDIKKKG